MSACASRPNGTMLTLHHSSISDMASDLLLALLLPCTANASLKRRTTSVDVDSAAVTAARRDGRQPLSLLLDSVASARKMCSIASTGSSSRDSTGASCMLSTSTALDINATNSGISLWASLVERTACAAIALATWVPTAVLSRHTAASSALAACSMNCPSKTMPFAF
eukprot:365113-Chlamydomonas_euryale.AAC.7